MIFVVVGFVVFLYHSLLFLLKSCVLFFARRPWRPCHRPGGWRGVDQAKVKVFREAAQG